MEREIQLLSDRLARLERQNARMKRWLALAFLVAAPLTLAAQAPRWTPGAANSGVAARSEAPGQACSASSCRHL